MRILLVNKFWYRRGGAEQVAFLTKELLEQAGHTVAVFGMQDPKNEIQTDYFSEPVNFENPRFTDIKRVFYNQEAKVKFKKLIADFKPDLIHFHNIYHQLSFSVIDAGREAGVPMLITIHDYHWLSPNYRLYHHGKIDQNWKTQSWFASIFGNILENFGKSIVGTIEFAVRSQAKYKTAITAFIFPSQFAADLHAPLGLQNKSVVMPNPLVEKNTAWTEGEYVLYLGRLSAEKGLGTVLAAAELIPEIPVVIAGSGPEESRLRQIISDKKLTNVRLVGQVSGAERHEVLQKARIVVVPSEWYENAPMSLVEAGAYGKVVLGSSIGGIPEELPTDWLVATGNAHAWAEKITEWFTCPQAKRKERGADFSKQILAKHDPVVYLKKLQNLYQRIIS